MARFLFVAIALCAQFDAPTSFARGLLAAIQIATGSGAPLRIIGLAPQ